MSTDYSTTVLLPKTEFPQRGNLPQREPETLAKWKALELWKKIEQRPAKGDYLLHDGPPYANGDIHIGHALNKSLKDFVVRYKAMRGLRARYVPGWDCHGLPIEQKVVEELRKKKELAGKSPMEIRKLCTEYAMNWKQKQSDQFQRLGVGGDWDHPYMTLDPSYEVEIMRALLTMNRRGLVYKGLRSVQWDWFYETALADSEIEYEDKHVSPSIYVRFPLLTDAPLPELKGASIVIWTTTPWTMPANLGICLHPEFDYVAYRNSSETIVIARGLLEAFLKETGFPAGEVVAEFKGGILEHARCKHPIFDDRASLVMLGEHVTLESGTGCVHTAPGHGADDFAIGKKYGLPPFCPVDHRGCYTSEVPEWAGVNVFDANPKVIEKLQGNGSLLWAGKVTHKYPYSYRSRKPVITRATEQWFVDIDKDDLRKRALAEVDRVQWVPQWGYERITAMLSGRPDWCISRQRAWGVPIPSLRDTKENTSVLDSGVIEKAMALIAKEGTDAWFTHPVEDFLTDDLKAHGTGRYEKEFDILDVWFESGCSHLAVLTEAYNLHWPADLYLEGSDQHRGWFQSSLWVSMGVKDRAPFNTVLTHGFVLDEKGQAMSKSLGNVISPLDIIKDSGADVLRLWIASEDYRRDVNLGKNSIAQVSNVYRRYRNTVRFLLGNTADFDPEKHTPAADAFGEEDKWLRHRLDELIEECLAAYDAFEFHRVFHALNNFCVVELGGVYLDMLKDRLYCDAADAPQRRASQAVLFDALLALLKLAAPIAPFTPEEAWGYLPPWTGKPESVHLSTMPEPNASHRDAAVAARWQKFLVLKAEVNKPLETLRAEKKIGQNLDARVVLTSNDAETLALLRGNRETLRRLLIVSQLEIAQGDAGAVSVELAAVSLPVKIEAAPAAGEKCPRCWTYTTEPGTAPDHPALCPRCADVIRRTLA